jgi:hypothetical protein
MNKDMKSKLIILGYVLILNCFQCFAQDTTSVVNVRIERENEKTSNLINLVFENMMQEDTLFVSSEYFIDEYYRPMHILIYRCEKASSSDSVKCDWGYSAGDISPVKYAFSDEKLIKILPREKIMLKFPVSHFYYGYEIFFEIRMGCIIREKIFLLSKTTNKILFDKNLDEYEKYQMNKK